VAGAAGIAAAAGTATLPDYLMDTDDNALGEPDFMDNLDDEFNADMPEDEFDDFGADFDDLDFSDDDYDDNSK
jgi:hypothetical protein